MFRRRCRQSALLLLLLAQKASPTEIHAPPPFNVPQSPALDHVNLLIGNGGDTPNGSGGMIPSTSPPFGMTRWVAQTQASYVSATPYNWTLNKVHGFVGTRQPAIWMGESGLVGVVPGVLPQGGEVKVGFDERALNIVLDDQGEKNEVVSVGYYSVVLDDGHGGTVLVEQSATSRVGHLRFTFSPSSDNRPYIFIEAARPSILTSTSTNVSYPSGFVSIDGREICGYSSERQDWIITPISQSDEAAGFKGYFCARFDFQLQEQSVIIQNGTTHHGQKNAEGPLLGAYTFAPTSSSRHSMIDLRVGTSFISVDQARANIDDEIPDSPGAEGSLETTAKRVRSAWASQVDRITIDGASDEEKDVFFTGVVHTLQYPSEQHEQGRYYSGYDNTIHPLEDGGESYTGYSIWDTFRAQWAWTILFVPDRVPGMVQSMLADYQQSGWLPMWKNIVETNIMVGTHADSLIAEAVLKGITGFDRNLAWEAVWKDATTPPQRDWEVVYADREEHVDYEVRAGLSSVYNVPGKGWVADDIHSESASRTLDYAYDDYAAYVLARELGKPANVTNFLLERALRAPFTLFNDATGFMEARNADGSWAGEDNGWTEGDKWAYSFDVVHDVPELIKRRGGNLSFVRSLDEHFDGGHNEHSNEPSHHIPYLYAMAGAAYKTQERVREIAKENYNNSPTGLSGNEDCGQMSAWYIFSAMGFYPVNPVSGEYIVGSPFFEDIFITLQGTSKKLHISAPGALTKPYIKSLTLNGEKVPVPIIRHEQIAHGAEVVFEMSDRVERWGNDGAVLEGLGLRFNKQAGAQETFEGWVDSASKATEKISLDRNRIEL
ncbi:glycoside hydrolase family 92 protein [Laccaria bicolor S238N-H82]|uniref:Glycoside hydrolase family 92 protein n=1 Tax=Laccaria bicolor (strain S238N-H82 / ATCC MYA-4686) TaxID=486041 RepID=B0DDS7_LACBS|nr:glycoside hydrolase family 92 protein [Laccaria bicolor S238N-H82]EDR07263.1 glycoside hydrolase family 92 protein [Laccaria bicolor S238N-H82]|eukprot:XP_001882194.1 glycoside hydrolase family 92 protein [Laccaria bicolor S238N-H82]